MSALPELPPELANVDPGSPPPDPMLQQEPVEDEYGGAGEFEEREKVELCLLGAIERCAKGVEVGIGASNADFAMKYAQAAASLGQSYAALVGAEAAEAKGEATASSARLPSRGGYPA